MHKIRFDCNLEMLSPMESHVLVTTFVFWALFFLIVAGEWWKVLIVFVF